MSIESCFEVPEKARMTHIDDTVALLPKEDQEAARERATAITTSYMGRDIDALSVLRYAAERGRFDEMTRRLEENHRKNLRYVHPKARKDEEIPSVMLFSQVLTGIYREMGIQLRK